MALLSPPPLHLFQTSWPLLIISPFNPNQQLTRPCPLPGEIGQPQVFASANQLSSLPPTLLWSLPLRLGQHIFQFPDLSTSSNSCPSKSASLIFPTWKCICPTSCQAWTLLKLPGDSPNLSLGRGLMHRQPVPSLGTWAVSNIFCTWSGCLPPSLLSAAQGGLRDAGLVIIGWS